MKYFKLVHENEHLAKWDHASNMEGILSTTFCHHNFHTGIVVFIVSLMT